jgi:predicted nucleic acid-binding protein
MKAIIDAGPLIAAWNQDDQHHAWAEKVLTEFSGPYFTTEPVLTEVAHMTGLPDLILEGVASGKFIVAVSLLEDGAAMLRLVNHYPDCGLADASLIALSEKRPTLSVLTTDKRHFQKYRRADKSPVPVVTP